MFVFLVVIAAALVVAVLVGGDVRRLSQIRLEHPEVLLAAFGAKIAVAALGATHSLTAAAVARPLNVVGALLLLGVAWLNRSLPGARVFGGGLTLNLLALVSFGGRMPVLLSHNAPTNSPALALLRNGLDPLHIWLPAPRGLWFIGDIFTIPGLNGHASVVSLGDLLMAGAIAWLIVRCSRIAPAARRLYRASPSR